MNQADPREIARFLQDADSLAEELIPIERDAFWEIVARRAEGASDEDLQDVTDAIPLPSRAEMMRLHEQAHHHGHGHEREHEHRHCEHEHGEAHGHKPRKKHSPRRPRDLGWA